MAAEPILILTRPEADARAFAARVRDLRQAQARVVISPAFAIRPEPAPLPDGIAGLVLTSRHGVAEAARRGLAGLPAWCVGDATADAARAAGLDARSASGDAEALVDLLLAERPAGLLVHLAGAHHRGEIAERLTDAGLNARRITAYRQEPLGPSDALRQVAEGTAPAVAAIFSPRSVLPLAALSWTGPLHGIAMSAAVAEALQTVPCDTLVTVPRPEAFAMAEATAAALDRIVAAAG